MRKIFVRIGLTAAVALGTAVVPVAPAGAAITDPIVVMWDLTSGGSRPNVRAGTFSDGSGGTLEVSVDGAGSLGLFSFVSMNNPAEYGTLSGTYDALVHDGDLQAFFGFTFSSTISEAAVVFRDVRNYQAATSPSGYTISAGVGETVTCSVASGLVDTSMSNNVWSLPTSAQATGIQSGVLLCTGSFSNLKFVPRDYTMMNGSGWFNRMTLVVDSSAIPSQAPPTTTPTAPVAPAYTG